MYYYKTEKWFAPMNSISYFKITDKVLAVFFNNGEWEYIGKTLELLDDCGKIVNSYDDCASNNTEIIQNRFESIIADYIQVNKPPRIY